MCHYLQYIFSSKDRTWRNLCANGKAKNQNQTNVIFELSGCTALKTGVSDCIIEITGRPLNGSSSCSPVWPLSHLEGHCQCWKTSTGFRATYAPIQERACIFQQGKLDSVSHRLFLMLYFLKTADSYVKYTKTVVNEPWQATACGNPVKPRNNRRVQFFFCAVKPLLYHHTARWHLPPIVQCLCYRKQPGSLTVCVSQVPGCIPLHCVLLCWWWQW